MTQAYEEEGLLVNSGEFDRTNEEAKKKIAEWMQPKVLGKSAFIGVCATG